MTTVQEDSKHAGGAVAGGLLGAIGRAAPPRPENSSFRGCGRRLQGAATGGTVQQYTVELVTGDQELISTEQDDIREGDCVAVEQGDYTDLRRVGRAYCDGANDEDPPQHQQQAASSCDAAKNELAAADTDDEVDLAVKKVRVLCDL